MWGFLGTIHIIYTFFTKKLEPRDAATAAAMKATRLVLTRRTNLWNGWIGFNASFGLGLLLFGTTYLLLAAGHMSLLRESPALTWLPVVGSTALLAIAGRYFFRRPFVGVTLATACFLAAAFALHQEGPMHSPRFCGTRRSGRITGKPYWQTGSYREDSSKFRFADGFPPQG